MQTHINNCVHVLRKYNYRSKEAEYSTTKSWDHPTLIFQQQLPPTTPLISFLNNNYNNHNIIFTQSDFFVKI